MYLDEDNFPWGNEQFAGCLTVTQGPVVGNILEYQVLVICKLFSSFFEWGLGGGDRGGNFRLCSDKSN